jgi:hypothetical protein
MSSTCFEPEGSSSGRRLYIQLWFATCRIEGASESVINFPVLFPYLTFLSNKMWKIQARLCCVHTGGVKGNSLRSYDDLQADGSNVGTENSEAHAAFTLTSNLVKENAIGSKTNEVKML